MKKTYLHIALALAVTAASFVGMTEEAFAKTEDVEWNVTYTGKGSTGFESDYTDDIKKQISNAMPGDTLVYTANYKNASDKTMDFFLSADVLSSLEDDKNGKAAVGGAYSYIVTYDSGSGEQIIYDSETVGGDNDVQKGLNQVKNGNAFVSVGTLESNQTGRVKLEVKLDEIHRITAIWKNWLSLVFSLQLHLKQNLILKIRLLKRRYIRPDKWFIQYQVVLK